MPLTDVPNIIAAVLSLAILVGLVYIRQLTGANGFIWKAAAFGWIAFCRVLLVAGVHPFVAYSAQLAVPFYALFGVGLGLTIAKLRTVYGRTR
jgi:hypothetical protein